VKLIKQALHPRVTLRASSDLVAQGADKRELRPRGDAAAADLDSLLGPPSNRLNEGESNRGERRLVHGRCSQQGPSPRRAPGTFWLVGGDPSPQLLDRRRRLRARIACVCAQSIRGASWGREAVGVRAALVRILLNRDRGVCP
jgi:hypothetical protein